MNLKRLFLEMIDIVKVDTKTYTVQHHKYLSFTELYKFTQSKGLTLYTHVQPGPLISGNLNTRFIEQVLKIFKDTLIFKSKRQLIAYSHSNFSVIEKHFILHLTIINISSHIYLEIGTLSSNSVQKLPLRLLRILNVILNKFRDLYFELQIQAHERLISDLGHVVSNRWPVGACTLPMVTTQENTTNNPCSSNEENTPVTLR